MGKWILVNPADYEESRPGKIRGVDVKILVSPYDIPAAVFGEYDEALKKLVITFKYATEDEPSEPSGPPNLTFWTGKKSKRLLRIAIDVDEMQAKEVRLAILSELEKLAHDQSQKDFPADNYGIVRKLFAEKGEQILEPVACK